MSPCRHAALTLLVVSALLAGGIDALVHAPRFPVRITITYVVSTPTPAPLSVPANTLPPYLQCCPAEPEWGAQAAQQMQALRQHSAP